MQANLHTHIYVCEQKNFSYSGVAAAAADRLTITIENPNICTFFHRNSYRETSHDNDDDPQLFSMYVVHTHNFLTMGDATLYILF